MPNSIDYIHALRGEELERILRAHTEYFPDKDVWEIDSGSGFQLKILSSVCRSAVSLETADSWGWPPGHSFDEATLQAVSDVGITQLSDGFSLHPYRDARGIMWVPQQPWRFRKMLFGVWTMCLHVNRWDSTDLERFRSNLGEFQARLTDWQAVVLRYQNRKHRPLDSIFSSVYPAALRLRIRLANRAISE